MGTEKEKLPLPLGEGRGEGLGGEEISLLNLSCSAEP